MKIYRALLLANAIIGGILATGGAVTALAGTLGDARGISVALAILGVVQLLGSNVMHALADPTQPPPAKAV